MATARLSSGQRCAPLLAAPCSCLFFFLRYVRFHTLHEKAFATWIICLCRVFVLLPQTGCPVPWLLWRPPQRDSELQHHGRRRRLSTRTPRIRLVGTDRAVNQKQITTLPETFFLTTPENLKHRTADKWKRRAPTNDRGLTYKCLFKFEKQFDLENSMIGRGQYSLTSFT